MNNVKSWLVSVIGIVLVYGVVNGVLLGGQALWHIGDTKKINEINQYLTTTNTEIENLKSKIESENEELERMDVQLQKHKATGKTTLYNLGVDKYNSLLYLN